MATVVNVYEAKSHFSELLGRAEAGEDIVIARHGRPIVQLVAVASRRPDRVLGQAAGRLWIADDFDDPLRTRRPPGSTRRSSPREAAAGHSCCPLGTGGIPTAR